MFSVAFHNTLLKNVVFFPFALGTRRGKTSGSSRSSDSKVTWFHNKCLKNKQKTSLEIDLTWVFWK